MGLFFSWSKVQASTATIMATVKITVCGNGNAETDEQCDGSDLGRETCQSRGYDSGVLSCNADCTFNTSACVSEDSSSSGGSSSGGSSGSSGSGGGSGLTASLSENKVILQGKAYPNAEITILKDGQVSTIINAGPQANFKAELTTLTAGVYTFGVWAEDKKGRKSITFNFTVNVSSGTITTVGGIFLPPTIELNKIILNKGEVLDILGQTAPQSEIDIQLESPQTIIQKTAADASGEWSYPFNTNILNAGSHTVRAKAVSADGLLSSYSKLLMFYIGTMAPAEFCPNADLNKDNKTNLVDFSIMLYWWGRHNPCVDQNQNGKVDLTDFSIMLYYWTG
jgi:hypothetical protein